MNFRSYPTLNSRSPLQISMVYIETIDVWTENHATQISAARRKMYDVLMS